RSRRQPAPNKEFVEKRPEEVTKKVPLHSLRLFFPGFRLSFSLRIILNKFSKLTTECCEVFLD
ncbi:MAG: hypothetical protein WBL84_20485, partial [Xanthobacteraceae bacterium]